MRRTENVQPPGDAFLHEGVVEVEEEAARPVRDRCPVDGVYGAVVDAYCRPLVTCDGFGGSEGMMTAASTSSLLMSRSASSTLSTVP